MTMHTIRRNGVEYDRLDPRRHAVIQMAASLAEQHQGDRFTCHDESGRAYYEVRITCPHDFGTPTQGASE